MFTQDGVIKVHHFAADEFEPFLLEAFENFADESSLEGVGFDHDEGSFHSGGRII